MTTNEGETLIKVEVKSESFEIDGCHSFELDQLAFDEREDACTQTDSYTACKPVEPREVSESELCQLELVESAAAAMSFFESQYQISPNSQLRTGQNINKTPKTEKMLKEKHRENERLRHHSLNEHLRLICRKVPGSAEDGKETKVVMMQRIISYIAYLENTIKFISSQLDIPSEPSWQLLTSSVMDIENSGSWRKEFTTLSSDDSRDSDNFFYKISRRLKLSSPTIDSTTDPVNAETSVGFKAHVKQETIAQESQDSTVPTSSFYMDVDGEVDNGCQEWLVPTAEVVIDGCENFDTVLNSTEFDHSVFEVPSSTFETQLMETPEKVEWLGSPDRSPSFLQGKHEKHFGIKCDSRYVDEQAYDMSQVVIVSPDQVLPQTIIKQEQLWEDTEAAAEVAVASTSSAVPEQTETLVYNLGSPFALTMHSPSQPVPRNSKRKQSSPRRAPLLNITNWADVPYEFSGELQDDGGLLKDVATVPVSVVGNYIEVESSTSNVTVKKEVIEETGEEVPTQQLEEECQRVLREARNETISKLDLRKSSWMNGFMMYSRIHRKKFIKENPGLHTSNISKLMGHAWREMTNEQQQPYKEHAKICSLELQRMLDQSCSA